MRRREVRVGRGRCALPVEKTRDEKMRRTLPDVILLLETMPVRASAAHSVTSKATAVANV